MPGVSTAPPRWVQALAYIIERIVRSGTSPSYGDIGRALGVSRERGAQLVRQLVRRKLIEKTPGAQRDLRVRDVQQCRSIIEQYLRGAGWIAADPLGPLRQAFTHVQLPVLPPFEHLPDSN